jgi:hypothetical protein
MATDVRVRVIKNKVAAPFKEAKVRVRFGRGFDNFWTALQILVAHKKIIYSSGYHYFERSPELVHPAMPRQSSGNKRPYLRTEIFDFADEYSDWRDRMIDAARLVLRGDAGFGDVSSEVEPDSQENVSPLVQDDEDLLREVVPVVPLVPPLVASPVELSPSVGGVRVVDPLA